MIVNGDVVVPASILSSKPSHRLQSSSGRLYVRVIAVKKVGARCCSAHAAVPGIFWRGVLNLKEPMSTPVVEMRGITVKFPGVVANDNVSIDVYSGEILALLGERGGQNHPDERPLWPLQA